MIVPDLSASDDKSRVGADASDAAETTVSSTVAAKEAQLAPGSELGSDVQEEEEDFFAAGGAAMDEQVDERLRMKDAAQGASGSSDTGIKKGSAALRRNRAALVLSGEGGAPLGRHKRRRTEASTEAAARRAAEALQAQPPSLPAGVRGAANQRLVLDGIGEELTPGASEEVLQAAARMGGAGAETAAGLGASAAPLGGRSRAHRRAGAASTFRSGALADSRAVSGRVQDVMGAVADGRRRARKAARRQKAKGEDFGTRLMGRGGSLGGGKGALALGLRP